MVSRLARRSERIPRRKSALCRRERQTLARLLRGDSEKQVALALGLSHHTVHIYVKSLYTFFSVSSRGELLSSVLRSMIEGIQHDRISMDDLREDRCQFTAGELTVQGTDFWLRLVNASFPNATPDIRVPQRQRRVMWQRIPGFDAR